jgi:hypothetical protein
MFSRLTSHIHPPHRGALNLAVGFNPRDGSEYSRVASATVELPRDLASVGGSIVADATVKTFHAHRGLMAFEN